MKQGWRSKKLGDVCEVIAGQSPKGEYYNSDGVGLPFYQGKKEFTGKYIGLPKKWTSVTTKEALKDDVLMSVRAPVGPVNFSTQRICIGRGLAAIRTGSLINKEFLYNFLVNHENQIVGNTGAVFNSINQTQIKSIPIPVPPLEEQKQIVAKLDQCFEAIDKAKANAAKNLENAKELFQSKLNEIFSQKGEGWVEKKLGEISDVTYGFTDKSVEVGDFRYVRITDIDNNGELISTGKKYIGSSKDGKKFILKDNDILMARTGATFAKLLLYKDIEPSIFASYLIKIDFTESIDNEFYWFYAKSNSYWDQANTLSTGSAQPHFNGKALKQVLFPYPVSKTEQSRLINEFKRFQSKTQSLESKYQQELNSLEELKKSILQKAFEGEL